LHDIPNTVAGAVRAAGTLGASFLTVHASGGVDMMRAASEAASAASRGPGAPPVRILAVTVLTSLGPDDLAAAGRVPGPRPRAPGRSRSPSSRAWPGATASSPHRSSPRPYARSLEAPRSW